MGFIASTFVLSVLSKLKNWVHDNEHHIKQWCEENGYTCYEGIDVLKPGRPIPRDIGQMEKDGWDEKDVFKYMINLEDIDPRISEETASYRMREIASKYPKQSPF